MTTLYARPAPNRPRHGPRCNRALATRRRAPFGALLLGIVVRSLFPTAPLLVLVRLFQKRIVEGVTGPGR
ncbi:hypothetical protein [Streptomyces sp. 3N207]|uniref:hypothetical protein n=1 Tax=Streptomyces sp. 3N207 TaxID=3457417 RepID=UPI003FD3BC6E